MSFDQKVQLSLTALLIGLVIVFVMLIFVMNRIKSFGAAKDTQKSASAGPVLAAGNGQHKAAPIAEAGIPEEVVAAISAAVYMMYGTSGAAVTSIRRSAQPARSAWAMAGLLENTRPF